MFRVILNDCRRFAKCYDERFNNVVRYYADLYQLFSLLNGCHPVAKGTERREIVINMQGLEIENRERLFYFVSLMPMYFIVDLFYSFVNN